MATTQLAGSSVRNFSPSEFARFAGKDLATARNWFEHIPGVRKYPRGHGNQKPSLGIPEPIARAKALEIGYTEDEIRIGLIEAHDRRLLEKERARIEQAAPPPASSQPAGKPGKSKKKTPGKKIYTERRRRK